MTTKGFYDAMPSIMSDFSARIGEQISSTMTGDKEKSRKNDQLRHEDLMRGVNALRSDIVKAQHDQLKNLKTFSQNILREITVAMMATTMHTDTMNQGLLQAIFDLMANCSNVPTGNTAAVPSSSTDPLSGDVPGQGSTLFEEDPCIPYTDKGKKHEMGSRTPRSEPITPGLMHQTPQMGQDNGHTAPSTPLGTKGDRPPWHTPNSGHMPSPSPRWGRPPLNPRGWQSPNRGPGGDPNNGDGGGGGGRGGGGGGGDTPDPGRPPEDPGDGGPGRSLEDPPDESPDRDPRRGRTPRSGITSIPPLV